MLGKADKIRGPDRRTLLRGGAVAAIASPALIGSAFAAGEVNWRVQAHWPAASASFKASLQRLADVLSDCTDGAFRLELFGDGEFAKGPDIFNIVRKGVVEMGVTTGTLLENYATVAPFVYGMPGTFTECWQLAHAIKNLGLEALINQELSADGVLLLSEKILPIQMTTRNRISSVKDLKGLKIRSAGMMQDYFADAGAAPQYISGAELYQALSAGIIDGAHWGAAVGAKSMSLWEVCRFHYSTVLAQTSDSYIINIKHLEALSDDLRNVLLSTIESRFFLRSSEYQHEEALALRAGALEDRIEILPLPDDVKDKLSESSAKLLETEGQKSELAAKAADIYRNLMNDLSFVTPG